MSTHQADAKRMLDDRGYSGPLIRGQNPALLMEKPLRDRITTSYYWAESCFGLNEATLCDRAASLTFVGGTSSTTQKPSPFICLLFKMLQLNPSREIVLAYLQNEHFKYLTALAAFYVRLTFDPVEVYKVLEPFLADMRRLRRRRRGGVAVVCMDEWVDELLTADRVCGTTLWKLVGRGVLEDLDVLEERESALREELEALDAEDDEEVLGGRESAEAAREDGTGHG